MRDQGARVTRGPTIALAFAAALIAAIGCLAYVRLRAATAAGEWAQHTIQVIAQGEVVLGHLRDAETGQRGYLLTDDSRYLQPYEEASAKVADDLATLRALTSDNPRQRPRVAELEPLVTAKLDELRRTIELRRTEGLDAALAVVRTDTGKRAMDAIRASIVAIQDEEHQLLAARVAERNRESSATGRYLALASALAAAIILAAALIVRRQIRRRIIAEFARRESEQRLLVTLASIGDAVIATDTGGNVTFMNTVAQDLTGWSEREAKGRPLVEVFNIINETSRIVAPSPVEKVLREGVIVGLANHTVLVRRDGREVPIDDSAAPIRDGGGDVMGVVLVFRDVSDRKEAEVTRERYVAAQATNQAKDEFLAVLSHELRAPLNAMLGWVRLLKKDGQKPEIFTRAVDVLERNIDVQTALINDLLDVSRIISGKLQLVFERVNLATLLAQVVEALHLAADAKNVALTYMPPGERLVTIVADPERIQQIVVNLIGNAIKFTPAGGRVDVRLEARDDRASVTVADTGIGIAASFLPHVFERFQQASESTTRAHGGLGLGLAIVKHLAERHGGGVAVRSDGPGLGATFIVTLPLAAADTRGEAIDGDEPAVAALGDVLVLLVEDDVDTRDALQLALERSGARVVTAANGDEALRAFDRHHPTIVATDITMPGSDGFGLVRAVRERDDGRTPAIAMTGLASKEDRAAALAAGFDEHLTKPIDPDDLVQAVRVLALARTSTFGTRRPASR